MGAGRKLGYNGTIEQRLERWSAERPTGCIEWIGTKRHHGYGSVRWNGKYWAAHRASYTVHIGPIPDGLYVLHKCDNPSCINPAHLMAGTQSQNMRDASAKGRAQEGHAKLTREQVLAILSDQRPGTVIAKELGVSPPTVHMIRRRRAWRHIDSIAA